MAKLRITLPPPGERDSRVRVKVRIIHFAHTDAAADTGRPESP